MTQFVATPTDYVARPIAGTAVYLVFARLHPTEPLGHLGTVRASNLDLAKQFARTTYDEDKWIEMIVVPRDAVTWVKKVEEQA